MFKAFTIEELQRFLLENDEKDKLEQLATKAI
jgi:hypothetical protein